MRKIKLLAIFAIAVTTAIFATPSTQIWIPSTDFQGFKTFHLGLDNYIRVNNEAPSILNNETTTTRGAGIYDAGITAGILPFSKIQAEVGIDYLSMGDGIYDKSPAYFNLKVGSPEDSLFKGCPGIAIGGYNFGTKKDLTNYNIMYALVAKTIPILGRISVGYYTGSKTLLVDELGVASNSGLLLSWDRAMTEISDKLWLAVDYQGGKNYLGALNLGFSWAFSKNVSVIFAYDIYNNPKALYNTNNVNVNSFTTQLDINF